MACLSFFSRSPGEAGIVRQAARHPAGRRWLRGPRSVLSAAVVVAAASGCETTAPPEVQEDTAIVTAGNSFQLMRVAGPRPSQVWYRATIPHSFTNRTGSNVYIDVGCGGRHFAGVDMDGGGEDGSGEWIHFWSPVHCLIGFGATVIEPGEVYQDTLPVDFCTPESRNCSPRVTLPAASTQFRIVWRAYSSWDEDPVYGDSIPGDPLPLEERVSNRFAFEVVH